MAMTGCRNRYALLPAAFLIAAGAAHSGELKIRPVRLTLTPDEPVSAMTLQNDGAQSAVFQLRVMVWRQENGEDIFEPTREVLANPGLFELKPGADQIARFGLQARQTARPGSYRIFIQEVPARPSHAGEIMTLLRISVPIFSSPADARPQVSWTLRPTSDGELEVEIRNDGDAHIQITSLSISAADGRQISTKPMSVYVLPGAWRRVRLETLTPVRAGDRLKLSAETDLIPMEALATVADQR